MSDDAPTPTDRHRLVYHLLVNEHPEGLTREDLARKAGLGDRQLRSIIEDLRSIAAITVYPRLGRPVVLGFDPELTRYAAAQDGEQALRIMRYQASRLRPMARALALQRKAAEAYPAPADADVQEALFEAGQALGASDWRNW